TGVRHRRLARLIGAVVATPARLGVGGALPRASNRLGNRPAHRRRGPTGRDAGRTLGAGAHAAAYSRPAVSPRHAHGSGRLAPSARMHRPRRVVRATWLVARPAREGPVGQIGRLSCGPRRGGGGGSSAPRRAVGPLKPYWARMRWIRSPSLSR